MTEFHWCKKKLFKCNDNICDCIDLTKYKSSDVSGNSLFGIRGIEWESYEGLIGIRFDSLKYSSFKSQGTIQSQTLNETYSIVGLTILFGIGMKF